VDVGALYGVAQVQRRLAAVAFAVSRAWQEAALDHQRPARPGRARGRRCGTAMAGRVVV
jgi:hypothetical protein